MSRQNDAIDIVKLYAEGDTKTWNIFLTNSLKKHDLAGLARTRNRLQRGMVLAAKQKLNTEPIQLWFIRLQRSIEMTMKKIVREKYPNPCDNPLTAKEHLEFREAKRRRDEELERYLRKTSY